MEAYTSELSLGTSSFLFRIQLCVGYSIQLRQLAGQPLLPSQSDFTLTTDSLFSWLAVCFVGLCSMAGNLYA